MSINELTRIDIYLETYKKTLYVDKTPDEIRRIFNDAIKSDRYGTVAFRDPSENSTVNIPVAVLRDKIVEVYGKK